MGKRLENLLDAYTAKRQEYDAFQLHCAAQTAEISESKLFEILSSMPNKK